MTPEELAEAWTVHRRNREALGGSVDAPAPPRAPAYPPLAAQAANLAGAAVRFVASGGATVPREEYERRRATCLACPTGRYDAKQDRCTQCGCSLSVKPWGKAEECPDGHWRGDA